MHGFEDSLFLDQDGQLSEGATWNLGLVDSSGTVVWPQAPVLPGITMRLLTDAYPQSAVQPVFLSDLDTMAAAFATNAAICVRPIARINERTFPTQHPTLDGLRHAYNNIRCEVI